MQRQLVFEPKRKLYFQLIYSSFLTRGDAPPDRRVANDELRIERNIIEALEAISEPVGKQPDEGEFDARPRVLAAAGGLLMLAQPAFSRLQGFLRDSQWRPGAAKLACDLQDWFDTAEKIEPDSMADKTPVKTRAGK